jgi:hypothetical protein
MDSMLKYILVLLFAGIFRFYFFIDVLSDKQYLIAGTAQRIIFITGTLILIALMVLGIKSGFKEIAFFLVVPLSASAAVLKVSVKQGDKSA